MTALEILRSVFALAIVLGLILALAYGLKRYAPQILGKIQAPRGRKRLEVVETLVLDPVRRLVLVRLDDEERLILLGEGRELAEPPVERKAKALVAQSQANMALSAVDAVGPPPVAAAPRPVVPASVPAAKPKLVVPQPAAAPREELPKPRMYRAPERTAHNRAVGEVPNEVNDDLF